VAVILDRLTPRQAATMGARDLARVRAQHTYTHRARQFESIIYSADRGMSAATGGTP
jgi:hypothetical protein